MRLVISGILLSERFSTRRIEIFKIENNLAERKHENTGSSVNIIGK